MQEGVVIKSTGSWYEVRNDKGETVLCRLRGKIRLDGLRTTNPVAVGDKVIYEKENNKDTCVINKILPRYNVIVRKSVNLSKASHIIASNIGYHSFMISAKTGFQCDELKEIMKDKVSLFSGHSGVGKSALINRLDPDLNVRVGEISDVHEKGKHTTTFCQMFPLDFGGYIIDSPGIKEFGLYDMEKETLAQRFPEMRNLMHECKFSNCTHLHEPHCAIKKAVEENLIAEWRYNDYCNMMED